MNLRDKSALSNTTEEFDRDHLPTVTVDLGTPNGTLKNEHRESNLFGRAGIAKRNYILPSSQTAKGPRNYSSSRNPLMGLLQYFGENLLIFLDLAWLQSYSIRPRLRVVFNDVDSSTFKPVSRFI